MNPDKAQLLNLKILPARLTIEEAAWFLGFLPHEIPVLMAAKLLKPLGTPAVNGGKYFAASELERLKQDSSWLAKSSDAIVKYWRLKNGRKTAFKTATRGLNKLENSLSN